MPRLIHRLAPKTVEKLTKSGASASMTHDGGGLYLRVGASTKPLLGSASWTFRYMLDGKATELGLGPYPDVGLVEARAKADEARKLKAGGVDPLVEKRRQQAERLEAKSFRECAELCIDALKGGWRNRKHEGQWRTTLSEHAYPEIGTMPVQDIEPGHVVRCLAPIWQDKLETAMRLRGRIEMVLGWATANKYRSGPNAAAWKGNLQHLLPKPAQIRGEKKHHPALPYVDVGAFMADLRLRPGRSPRALEFLILTWARTIEALRAEWSEINADMSVWTIPAPRTKKKKRELRVPLTPAAVAVLQKMDRSKGKYIFPGAKKGRPLSDRSLAAVLIRMSVTDASIHGFRSTARDWAGETTSHPNIVCEMALGHAIGDKTEEAYRRGDLFERRRVLMADWAAYCAAPREAGTVLDFERRRASA